MTQKIILGFLGILLFGFSITGQEIKRQNDKITFPVSKVKPAVDLLPETDYKSALEICLDAEIEGFQDKQKGKKLVPISINGFIAALHNAFAQHRPMVISPDMIWLLICQGTALHIEKNQDSLRNILVGFEGKKNITLKRAYFIKGQNNNWPEIFPEFSDSIQKYLKDSLYQLFVPKFSTTGIVEKNAFEITFMSSVHNYFEFGFESFCGIPEITLEGSVEDWAWIANNISKLNCLGLSKWTGNLQPILKEFVNASQGKIDTSFWQSIYKYCSASGGARMTGWIIKFFPYIYDKDLLVENSLIEGKKFAYWGLLSDNIPFGYSKVDMDWNYFGIIYNMKLYAGFFGISQDSITKALRPEIAWAVVDSSKIKNDRIKISEEYTRTRDEKLFNNKAFSGVWTYPDKLLLKMMETQEWYHFEQEEIKTYYDGTDGSIIGPNLFPNQCKTYKESLVLLKSLIKSNLKREANNLKCNITFVVTWFGAIDKIKIIETNKPELNPELISILNNISNCKPAIYNGELTNAEVYIELDIK